MENQVYQQASFWWSFKKNTKLHIYSLCSFLFLGAMILFPKITLSGASQGLVLWFRNLLPALFPYTILSTYLLSITNSRYPELFAIFTGMLCGYPLGAKITAQLVTSGQITKENGQYLIGFCNMASPSFLIQYIAAQQLGSLKYLPGLLFSVYGSTCLTALITFPIYWKKGAFNGIKKMNLKPQIHWNTKHQTGFETTLEQKELPETSTQKSTLSDAILSSFESMIRLGGYLVVFSIIAKMVTALLTTVTTSHFFLIGVIEITNGAHFIAEGMLSMETKMLLLAFCVSFGGLSCLAQSVGMCENSRLSMSIYFLTKLMNGCIAFALMLLWCKGNLY